MYHCDAKNEGINAILTGKQVKNAEHKETYLVENAHEPIIAQKVVDFAGFIPYSITVFTYYLYSPLDSNCQTVRFSFLKIRISTLLGTGKC